MQLLSITPYFVHNHKKVCKFAKIFSWKFTPTRYVVKEFKLAELQHCYFLFKHKLYEQFVYRRMDGIKAQLTQSQHPFNLHY